MPGAGPAAAPSYACRVLREDPSDWCVSQPVTREIRIQPWEQVEREEGRGVNGKTHLKRLKDNCLPLKGEVLRTASARQKLGKP